VNFHTLHTISGFAIFLSLITKSIIHYYLDNRHGRGIGLNSLLIAPIQYLIPYRSEVNKEYRRLKFLCNSLIVITYGSLLLNLIFGVLILF